MIGRDYRPFALRLLIVAAFVPALAACDQSPEPAVLTDASPDTLNRLREALSSALGRSNVTLGAGDVTAKPEVLVLPPTVTPLEGNSPVMPVVFDIILQGGDCYVRRRGTQELFPISDVSCVPVSP